VEFVNQASDARIPNVVTAEIIGCTLLTFEFYVFAGVLFFLVNYAIERIGRRPSAASCYAEPVFDREIK
jgi:hypothetical protein